MDKKKKRHPNEKEVKLFLFTDMTLHVQNSKDSIHEIIRTNEFSKIIGYKSTHKNQLFLIH